MRATVGALFVVDRMDIIIGRADGPDWRLMRRSDAAEMIWIRLVEVFAIMTEIADTLACSEDVECRLARRSGVFEMR
jgi:hypothetical protein